MAYDGAGSLFALGMRITKLDQNGAPLIGANNSYVTDALIQVQLGLEYEDGDEITQKNGSGLVCLTYKAPDSLKWGTISGLQVCTPDPVVLGFITGGRVIESAGAQIGYGAPEVGENPNPNGVSIEVWTRAIINGAYAGYFHWVVPRAFLTPSGTWALSGADPLVPEFEGTCTQNPNWLDGPANDWPWQSERVWQYAQTDTLPDLTPGYRTVSPELTVTSLEVLPATASIAVAETEQLTATATMSDSSTRDVTDQAVWVSATPATCTVDDGGLVTGVAAGGPVNVTATYGAASDACAVTVS